MSEQTRAKFRDLADRIEAKKTREHIITPAGYSAIVYSKRGTFYVESEDYCFSSRGIDKETTIQDFDKDLGESLSQTLSLNQ